jgi:hypothetical protein
MVNRDEIARESRIITEYLLDQAPRQELIDRYVEGNTALLNEKFPRSDRAVMEFVRRNPWTLPYLDAAYSILQPGALLRRKILLQLAILETTPHFTDHFMTQHLSVPRFLCHLSGYGLSAFIKMIIGFFIYPFAVKRR